MWMDGWYSHLHSLILSLEIKYVLAELIFYVHLANDYNVQLANDYQLLEVCLFSSPLFFLPSFNIWRLDYVEYGKLRTECGDWEMKFPTLWLPSYIKHFSLLNIIFEDLTLAISLSNSFLFCRISSSCLLLSFCNCALPWWLRLAFRVLRLISLTSYCYHNVWWFSFAFYLCLQCPSCSNKCIGLCNLLCWFIKVISNCNVKRLYFFTIPYCLLLSSLQTLLNEADFSSFSQVHQIQH